MPIKDYGNKYDRLYVAIVTPMKENFDVDESAMRKHLRYFMQPKFVDAGGGIIINPEAGEVFYLSREEAKRNIEIAMEECGGRVPVFAGVAGLRTEEIVQKAIDAKNIGIDGLFLMPPIGMLDITMTWDADRYPEVFIDLAKAQADATGLPGIVHPVGSPSPMFGIGFPLNATLKICREIPSIVGWKMTYSYPGSILIAKGLRQLDRHVGVLRATARFFHENLATGYFDGTVTGSLNYGMEPMIDHIDAWRQGKTDEACRIWQSGLAELQEYIYADYSRLHVRYKLGTYLRGLIPTPYMRPPMPRPRKEEISKLRSLLQNAGLSVLPEKEIQAVTKSLHL